MAPGLTPQSHIEVVDLHHAAVGERIALQFVEQLVRPCVEGSGIAWAMLVTLGVARSCITRHEGERTRKRVGSVDEMRHNVHLAQKCCVPLCWLRQSRDEAGGGSLRTVVYSCCLDDDGRIRASW